MLHSSGAVLANPHPNMFPCFVQFLMSRPGGKKASSVTVNRSPSRLYINPVSLIPKLPPSNGRRGTVNNGNPINRPGDLG